MKPKRPTKERIEEVNNFCVKTYMEILGYKATLEHPSYVVFESPFPKTEKMYISHSTGKYFLDHGGKEYGVLDLASRLFKVSKSAIMMDIMPYKIDVLLDRCHDKPGPAW